MLEKCSSAKASITEMIDEFLGKEDKRQGIVRNPKVTVMSRIYTAARYISSRQSGITTTETTLLKQADDHWRKAIQTVNEFYQQQWPALRQEIETLDLSEFKEVEEF